MILTPQEFELLRKAVKDGHEITEITKSETEFRVHFQYLGGNACGSRAVVYNLGLHVKELITDIQKGEKALGFADTRNPVFDGPQPRDKRPHRLRLNQENAGE